MAKGYVFLEHTADILFEARGKTVEELFEQCALATEATMVDLKSVKERIKREIIVDGESVEALLYNFLEELIFVKDAEQFLFKSFKITIKKGKKYTLKAVCAGEKINPKKQRLLDDAKAITMHQFEVKQEKKRWMARVIIDV